MFCSECFTQSLTILTWKTTFLVLLATAIATKREDHALDYMPKFVQIRDELILVWNPMLIFVVKMKLRKYVASILFPVEIPALGPILGHGLEEDKVKIKAFAQLGPSRFISP